MRANQRKKLRFKISILIIKNHLIQLAEICLILIMNYFKTKCEKIDSAKSKLYILTRNLDR